MWLWWPLCRGVAGCGRCLSPTHTTQMCLFKCDTNLSHGTVKRHTCSSRKKNETNIHVPTTWVEKRSVVRSRPPRTPALCSSPTVSYASKILTISTFVIIMLLFWLS